MKDHSATRRILIADDNPAVLESLRLLLKGEGFRIESASSPKAILAILERKDFDVLLMDLNYARDTTSGQEGLDLLSRIQELDSSLPTVVMIAWGSVELAVEAMRRGARDFVEKPWKNARLVSILRTQSDLSRALRRGQRLEAENQALRENPPEMIAESQAMHPVMQLIFRMGPSDANILITVENGVRAPSRLYGNTRGRATSASWITPWRGRPSWRRETWCGLPTCYYPRIGKVQRGWRK